MGFLYIQRERKTVRNDHGPLIKVTQVNRGEMKVDSGATVYASVEQFSSWSLMLTW